MVSAGQSPIKIFNNSVSPGPGSNRGSLYNQKEWSDKGTEEWKMQKKGTSEWKKTHEQQHTGTFSSPKMLAQSKPDWDQMSNSSQGSMAYPGEIKPRRYYNHPLHQHRGSVS